MRRGARGRRSPAVSGTFQTHFFCHFSVLRIAGVRSKIKSSWFPEGARLDLLKDHVGRQPGDNPDITLDVDAIRVRFYLYSFMCAILDGIS